MRLTTDQAIDAIGPGFPEGCTECDAVGRHTLLDADDAVDHRFPRDGGEITMLVHTMSAHGFGADWTREAVTDLIRSRPEHLFLATGFTLGHRLGIFREDRTPIYVQTREDWEAPDAV